MTAACTSPKKPQRVVPIKYINPYPHQRNMKPARNLTIPIIPVTFPVIASDVLFTSWTD